MTFDENTLRSVIEEVLKEMGEVSGTAAAPAAAPVAAAAGKLTITGNPVKLSKTPPDPRHAAPLLGQDTRAVLAEFGYSKEQIDAWEAEKVF